MKRLRIWDKKIPSKFFPCKCGCGESVGDTDNRGRPIFYKKGHYTKGKKLPRITGENHPMWKGGKFVQTNGYIYMYSPEHPRARKRGHVFEHILVYEECHKCCILSWGVIHHKNGNKRDNRIENLLLTSSSNHAKIHDIPRDRLTGKFLPSGRLVVDHNLLEYL